MVHYNNNNNNNNNNINNNNNNNNNNINNDNNNNNNNCGEREETVGHLVAECKMLAQKYYKNWRHDKVAQVVHW